MNNMKLKKIAKEVSVFHRFILLNAEVTVDPKITVT